MMSKRKSHPLVDDALEYERKNPLADNPFGVRKKSGGFELFSRERGCESGHRFIADVEEVSAILEKVMGRS